MLTFFSVVLAAIIFEYSNGFHDAANAIATVVSTRVLTPRKAIAMAAFFNLTGALLGGAVASTIGKGLVDTDIVTMSTVLCAVIAAFAWNIATWWFGLPSSSSHALIGGLCGAALAAGAPNTIDVAYHSSEYVVGAGSGGVLLHEAVGHGLEGDFNRQGRSLYSGRVGERVASELGTIYDDGNLTGERGSIAIDDEGTPGQHKVLVENGILRGYMQDRLNARLMGAQSTGSGRRQSFRVPPLPRMCNTYMPDGASSYDEIVGSVKKGIVATSFAGGQVEISKGDFVFMLAEGYLIENGKITAPIRGATLVGNGPDVMTRVVMVGADTRFAGRSYSCGKGGQYVPVGVGMPTVKIASVTVGGSSLA